jgi:5-deoxy-glucuronate isomerase
MTAITREGEAELDAGIDFGIWRGAALEETHAKESVWLLMAGEAGIEWPDGRATVARRSLFDQPPTALHVPGGARVRIEGRSEWAVARAANDREFAARLYRPQDLKPEYRGQGLVQDASLRNVRLIFDYATRPESNLVIGEVVNYPGRWSSYPPHHHVQPEIYHYRFSEPQGYGHSELGEQVMKVRGGDTVRILDGVGHAQVSAPGYAMYYIWIVRHLAGNPYRGFHFDPEHEWVLDPARQGWRPAEGPA